VDSEVVHVIRGKTLSGMLRQKDAERALDAWRHLGVRRHLTHGHLERIWALRDDLTAYDATYVALAEALGCELLTTDGRLALAPRLRCPITRVAS
jgi:predicted nucleic acid-binding protein